VVNEAIKGGGEFNTSFALVLHPFASVIVTE